MSTTTSDSFSFSIDESEEEEEADVTSFTQKVVFDAIDATESIQLNPIHVFIVYTLACIILFIWQAEKRTWESLYTFLTGQTCIQSCSDQCPINSTITPFEFI